MYRLIILAICFISVSDTDGLKDVKLEGPKYVRQGDDVILTCRYDLEGEDIYTIKWYRGSEEFYRYLPKEVPSRQALSQRLIVDESDGGVLRNLRNEYTIKLKNATIELTSKFKCAVCVESTFQTLESTLDLVIVVVGYDSPILTVDRSKYYPGDRGLAKCTVEKTSPPVSIKWFIDDIEVTNNSKTETLVDPFDGLYTTVSTIPFTLRDSFRILKLRCAGSLFDVYSEASAYPIQPEPRRSAAQAGDRSQTTHLRSSATITHTGFAQKFLYGALWILVSLRKITLLV